MVANEWGGGLLSDVMVDQVTVEVKPQWMEGEIAGAPEVTDVAGTGSPPAIQRYM
jgi:hypothetical protein